ncbi:MAG: ATP-dependent sacrificial sulfur transferase LarE, partial [Thermoplasmatales archaeon]
KQAKHFAKNIGINHVIINLEETKIENFSKNSIDRCYYCKKELFSKIKQVALEKRLDYILDGSNFDDIKDYRPGIKALKELGVISPLKDVGLTKKEIRELSRDIGLNTWDKPSFACLASRFPYGIKITKSRLKKIEEAESFLHYCGVRQYRVRYHIEIARIETSKNDFKLVLKHSDEIIKKFKELGFKYITLDIEGYRTGSLNEVIKK